MCSSSRPPAVGAGAKCHNKTLKKAHATVMPAVFSLTDFIIFCYSEMANKSQVQTIDLTKLNLMQLTQFKNQLDQDLQFYQESLQNLKVAQMK